MLTKVTVLGLFGLDLLAVVAARAAGIEGLFPICLFVLVCHLGASALIMRLLIWFFPIQEGEFEEGSVEADRWQARAFLGCLSCSLLDQFLPIFLRAQWYMLFGAKLAWNAKIAGRIMDCSLVEMGPNALLGHEGLIMGHFQVGRKIRIGRVRVDAGATVGLRATVFPGARIEEHAVVGAGALVLAGTRVPAGEIWAGLPAKKMKDAGGQAPAPGGMAPAPGSRAVLAMDS